MNEAKTLMKCVERSTLNENNIKMKCVERLDIK